MTTITVAARTHSLVLTKAFAAKAAIFGSDEYKMLQEAQNIYAGLDYAYTKKYIAAHDNNDKTIEFDMGAKPVDYTKH